MYVFSLPLYNDWNISFMWISLILFLWITCDSWTRNFPLKAGSAPLWQNLCILRTVVLEKYFPHISHFCVCKAFLLCEKPCDSFGKLVWETISYKTNNFLFKNVFAPLWLYLRIFRPVAKFVHHRDSVFCKTFSTNITIMSL